MSAYSEKVEKIKEVYTAFMNEAELGETGRGCKAHALSARKLSVKLANELKEYRPLSIKNDKGEV
jgi:hypothetical protein